MARQELILESGCMCNPIEDPQDIYAETIAAVATPMGTGGIAICRISGGKSLDICDQMVRLRSGKRVNRMRNDND